MMSTTEAPAKVLARVSRQSCLINVHHITELLRSLQLNNSLSFITALTDNYKQLYS